MSVTQLPARVTLGGSTAAAAAGIHPYCSPVRLWAEMTGRLEPPDESEAMRWGTILEDAIRDELIERGYVAWKDDRARTDEARPWLVGHPDGYVEVDGGDRLLEVKTCSPFAWPHDGTTPVHYLAQCQVYLHLTGLDRALLAVLVGGQKLELRDVDRDDDQIGLLLELMERFVGYVVRDECPPPIGTDDERDAIRDLFPTHTAGRTVRLLGDDWKAYRELSDLRAQKDRLDDLIREREAIVKLAMGDAETALSPGDNVVATWRSFPRKAVDVKLLKEQRPELASLFTTTTETRRFELK